MGARSFIHPPSKISHATEELIVFVVVSFTDEASRLLWLAMKGKQVNLVPRYGPSTANAGALKADGLRRQYRVVGPTVFLHVELADHRIEFHAL